MDATLDYAERRTRAAIEELGAGERTARDVLEARDDVDLELLPDGDDRRQRPDARLHRVGRRARGQPQLPAVGDAVGLLLRRARAGRPRRAALRGRLPADRGDRPGGLPAERRAAARGRGGQRGDQLARRRPGPEGVRPRARAGDDEQPDARQRRLHLLRDDRRRPGRLPGRGRAERGARGDVEHAQHAGRGARARVPAARGRVLAAARAAGAAGSTAAATGSCARSRRWRR